MLFCSACYIYCFTDDMDIGSLYTCGITAFRMCRHCPRVWSVPSFVGIRLLAGRECTSHAFCGLPLARLFHPLLTKQPTWLVVFGLCCRLGDHLSVARKKPWSTHAAVSRPKQSSTYWLQLPGYWRGRSWDACLCPYCSTGVKQLIMFAQHSFWLVMWWMWMRIEEFILSVGT